MTERSGIQLETKLIKVMPIFFAFKKLRENALTLLSLQNFLPRGLISLIIAPLMVPLGNSGLLGLQPFFFYNSREAKLCYQAGNHFHS